MTRRTVHLAAGLTLFTYITGHLINHSFGIISLDALEAARWYLTTPWTSVYGIAILTVAILVHLGSALWVIYSRRTLKMPTWQWFQLGLGLTIPLLVADHAFGTAYARLVFGLEPNYAYVLASNWHFDPIKAWMKILLLCAAWGHGSVGIHHWLKVKPWYPRWSMQLYMLALLLPVLAISGFVSAGLEVLRLAQDPSWLFGMIQAIKFPGNDAVRHVYEVRDLWMYGYVGVVIAVFVLRYIRQLVLRQRSMVRVLHETSGRRVVIEEGATLLEALKQADIPHASVCGGRARCSTCRVRLINPPEGSCDVPNDEEARILRKLGLPPNVRLACQLRPKKNVVCEPLLPPDVTAAEALKPGQFTMGHEVELTVMFADLRGFTTLSEKKLPFDVVYLLNQYFEAMGKVIEENGGKIDKYIGDGIMATFGGNDNDAFGAMNALRAARGMTEQLNEMNERLANDLSEPLRLGIGLHTGPVIRGTMGYGDATQVTVIGDTVNTASRLEGETKVHGVQLLFSEALRLQAGFDASEMPTTVIKVRGRAGSMTVYKAEQVADCLTF